MNPAGADVRGLTQRLLAVVRDDDVDALATMLLSVVGTDAGVGRLLEPVLEELVGVVARSLRQRTDDEGAGPAEPVGDDTVRPGTFTADLVDAHDNDVDIDEIDPALRAVLRAVLAELNDDREAALFQIGLVGGDPEPFARLDAVWHVLLWASVLGDPPSRRVPVPDPD